MFHEFIFELGCTKVPDVIAESGTVRLTADRAGGVTELGTATRTVLFKFQI